MGYSEYMLMRESAIITCLWRRPQNMEGSGKVFSGKRESFRYALLEVVGMGKVGRERLEVEHLMWLFWEAYLAFSGCSGVRSRVKSKEAGSLIKFWPFLANCCRGYHLASGIIWCRLWFGFLCWLLTKVWVTAIDIDGFTVLYISLLSLSLSVYIYFRMKIPILLLTIWLLKTILRSLLWSNLSSEYISPGWSQINVF